MMKKKLDHRFWANYFKVYDVLNMVIPYQELLDTIVKELDVKRGDLILDAGCGTGNLGIKLKKRGVKVIGIDYCIEALDIYKQKDPKAELMVHDLNLPLPFPDNYFDKIVSNNVIYSLSRDKIPLVIKEFKRVLKKSGFLVITNPAKNAKPMAIYKEHLKKTFTKGINFLSIVIVTRMMASTVRMFYYNLIIKKANKKGFYTFFDEGEQTLLLKSLGFKPDKEYRVYSNQAIIVRGQNV